MHESRVAYANSEFYIFNKIKWNLKRKIPIRKWANCVENGANSKFSTWLPWVIDRILHGKHQHYVHTLEKDNYRVANWFEDPDAKSVPLSVEIENRVNALDVMATNTLFLDFFFLFCLDKNPFMQYYFRQTMCRLQSSQEIWMKTQNIRNIWAENRNISRVRARARARVRVRG